MAALTIRNLDDSVKAKLRVRAAHNGRSMEAEVRAILSDALGDDRASPDSPDSPRKVAETGTSYAPPSKPEAAARQGDRLTWETVDDESLNAIIHAGPEGEDFLDAIVRVFGALGGIELELPDRNEPARFVDFSGPGWDLPAENSSDAVASGENERTGSKQ
jgi:plasmid stability protein